MRKRITQSLLMVSGIVAASLGASGTGVAAETDSLLERGRYLVQIAGCNDCHTPGYMMSEGEVPESLWLTGEGFGWRGAWGTTYPTNLRLRLAELTEAQWLAYAKGLKARPPMPWFNLNRMAEDDLRAIYRYVRHLGPAGSAAPAYIPPEQEPAPPYALFPSPPPTD